MTSKREKKLCDSFFFSNYPRTIPYRCHNLVFYQVAPYFYSLPNKSPSQGHLAPSFSLFPNLLKEVEWLGLELPDQQVIEVQLFPPDPSNNNLMNDEVSLLESALKRYSWIVGMNWTDYERNARIHMTSEIITAVLKSPIQQIWEPSDNSMVKLLFVLL